MAHEKHGEIREGATPQMAGPDRTPAEKSAKVAQPGDRDIIKVGSDVVADRLKRS